MRESCAAHKVQSLRSGLRRLRLGRPRNVRSEGGARGMRVAWWGSMVQQSTPTPSRFVVLAAIDTSASAERVLQETGRVAQVPHAEVHLAHVLEPIPVPAAAIGGFAPVAVPSPQHLMKEATQYLERQMHFLEKLAQKRVVPHLPTGRPWQTIVQLATDIDADLLVIGTHDAKGWERLLLGSITELISRAAPCPVLVAREKRGHRMDVPAIEPPCVDCLKTQRETNSAKLWCERHSQHHPRAHTYNELPEGFGSGSMSFRE